MAAELRITPEWIGKILKGRVEGSHDIGLRLDELLRRRALEHSSITYPNLTEARHSKIEEAPASYGNKTSHPMRIRPGFTPPASEPTEQAILNYLQHYLRHMRTVPGGLGHTYIELQRHFPLPKEPPDEDAT